MLELAGPSLSLAALVIWLLFRALSRRDSQVERITDGYNKLALTVERLTTLVGVLVYGKKSSAQGDV
jgi:hypothetical protein